MTSFLVLAALALVGVASQATGGTHGEVASAREPVSLTPSGKLPLRLLPESSGLVQSRRFPGVFWTHNDSGNQARLFSVRRDGTLVIPAGGERGYEGVRVLGAVNVDWEDIAVDDAGNLFVGDIGNNANARTDLAVYVVPEPDPFRARSVAAIRKIRFFYPDQGGFPPKNRNYDAEALFWARGKLHLLTKHRSDTQTTLYRFDATDPSRSNPLTRLASFDIRGQVTAADASADGGRLAVLTYDAVWLFKPSAPEGDFFSGEISWLPLEAGQCEAICFVGDSLLIGNEQGDLYEVGTSDLITLRR